MQKMVCAQKIVCFTTEDAKEKRGERTLERRKERSLKVAGLRCKKCGNHPGSLEERVLNYHFCDRSRSRGQAQEGQWSWWWLIAVVMKTMKCIFNKYSWLRKSHSLILSFLFVTIIFAWKCPDPKFHLILMNITPIIAATEVMILESLSNINPWCPQVEGPSNPVKNRSKHFRSKSEKTFDWTIQVTF